MAELLVSWEAAHRRSSVGDSERVQAPPTPGNEVKVWVRVPSEHAPAQSGAGDAEVPPVASHTRCPLESSCCPSWPQLLGFPVSSVSWCPLKAELLLCPESASAVLAVLESAPGISGLHPKSCHFREGRGCGPTALASLPGLQCGGVSGHAGSCLPPSRLCVRSRDWSGLCSVQVLTCGLSHLPWHAMRVGVPVHPAGVLHSSPPSGAN